MKVLVPGISKIFVVLLISVHMWVSTNKVKLIYPYCNYGHLPVAMKSSWQVWLTTFFTDRDFKSHSCSWKYCQEYFQGRRASDWRTCYYCSSITRRSQNGQSKSNSSCPHLVQVQKGGKLVCDENCLIWTSLKICSHCVAVASNLGCLESFVKWYTANTKKPPNITKMTTKHVPQNIGKNQSHSRYSKRKSKLPVTSRIPPAFTSSKQSSVPSSVDDGSSSSLPSTLSVPFLQNEGPLRRRSPEDQHERRKVWSAATLERISLPTSW